MRLSLILSIKYYFFNYYFYFVLFGFLFLFFLNLLFFLSWFFFSSNNKYFYIEYFYIVFFLFIVYFLSTFMYNVLLFGFFNCYYKPYQICYCYYFNGLEFDFCVDSFSLLFLMLTSFITLLCLLIHFYSPFFTYLRFYISKKKFFLNIPNNFISTKILFFFLKKIHIYLLILGLLNIVLFLFFTTLNFFVFYILLELSMLPLFLMIVFYGSRDNKLKAAYYIFFYTILGSIPFFAGLLSLYYLTGSFNLYVLYSYNFDLELQKIFWILFFISFAVKVPTVPFHVWLPEAHVEAPTEGSVILAGLLLKLGVYGLIRFLIPVFPFGWLYFSSFISTLAIISVLYTSILIFCQIDLKKIIAYSSIAHMNFAILGLFSFVSEGFYGGVYIFYTHGIVASGLFICIGCLYWRFYTRLLLYYGGITYYFPLFSFIFFLFILGNMSFPGTGGFIGELLIILGVLNDNFFVGIIFLLGSFFCTLYSIVFYTKISFGIPLFLQFNAQFVKIYDNAMFNYFFTNPRINLDILTLNFWKKNNILVSLPYNLSIVSFFLIEYFILFFLIILMVLTGFNSDFYLRLFKLQALYYL